MIGTTVFSKLNYYSGPIYETGRIINVNDPSTFKNALNDAVSYTQSVGSAVKSSASAPVPNTSLRWCKSVKEMTQILRAEGEEKLHQVIMEETKVIDEIRAATWQVPVGKGELLGLMKAIEEAAAKGEHFSTVLQKQIDKYIDPETGKLGVNDRTVDFLYVCPYTGEVKYATPRTGMVYVGVEFSAAGDDAVWDLAYDLQRFIQLRVFGNTEGMSNEEVEAEIADIKARQSEKDYSRYIDYTVEEVKRLYGEEEKEEATAETGKTADPIDEFLETIGKHQEQIADKEKKTKSGEYTEWLMQSPAAKYKYSQLIGGA